jgi:sugar O-acyltransferase (sialic acid O-acetyltransferase NeuD family)
LIRTSAEVAPLLYVIGAGGHGRELSSYIEDLRRAGWHGELRGFLDDGVPAGRHGRINVLGPIDTFTDLKGFYITAFGSNTLRRQIVDRIVTRFRGALRPWTLIHPRACLGADVDIGEGTCVAPGAILTAGVTVGRHCIVNVNASVSHDCTIGNFVNINPGAVVCGTVTIGEGAYIGTGAVLKERVSIGAWSVVGAGAVVVRDVPPDVTVVGVPAGPISQS